MGGRIDELKGVGKKTAALFAKLGIETQEDLLERFPRRYEKYEVPTRAGFVHEGNCTVAGEVSGNFRSGANGSTSLELSDETGSLILRWFRNPYVSRMLKRGETYAFRGQVSEFAGRPCMLQPTFMPISDYMAYSGSYVPVYPLTKGLTNATTFRCVLQALSQMEEPVDKIPEEIRIRRGLIGRGDALRCIHWPADEQSLELARKRLVFEEFFMLLYEVRYRSFSRGRNGFSFPSTKVSEELVESLPYPLTNAQRRAIDDLKGDLNGFLVSNRLVQGDVGCGKTIVALTTMTTVAENGYQTALMAPTEVLAIQHFKEAEAVLERIGAKEKFNPVLLVGSMKEKEKKETRRKLESGESLMAIGTHALIQEATKYSNLALVVVDEQHRFGVEQREAFSKKSPVPIHAVVMTATPIPRTTGNVLFGGMDVTVIDEKPAKRLPIRSYVATPSMRDGVYALMRRELDAGRQAYVICPMVEEDKDGGKKSVEERRKALERVFPDVRIETLHGRMNPKEKNERMDAFARNEARILVATTVVEVGVNVPNATFMLVENADMFGMLQLHQIRGRVGRGDGESYCVFMNSKEERSEKLPLVAGTENGFEIAEADYALRKGGSLLGTRQSGDMGFVIADPVRDEALLLAAQEEVDAMFPKPLK